MMASKLADGGRFVLTPAKALRLVIALLVMGLLGWAVLTLPVQDMALSALQWIDGLGFVGYAVFTAMYIVFTVLFLPGFILTLGAGAIFGLVGGFITVSIGSTLGAASAFVIGRFLARDWVASKVSGNARFSAIDRAVGRQGWKIVFLTRMSPVFPFNLINYAYGLTRIPLVHYVLASWIGMIPGTLLYVYAGSLAGGVARAAAGEAGETGALQWVFQGIGLVATVLVTLYITRLARRALNDEVIEDEAVSEGGQDAAR